MTQTKKAMAARYTDVSLEDMEKFLKRGFRALRPRKAEKRGEVVYDLKLSPTVGIRVWTSISPRSGSGAGVGQDAIRVQLISLKDEGPLQKGKAPIVKRTQNWRNSLQDKIEDMTERYEEKSDFWDEWAGTRSRKGDPQKEMKRQEIEEKERNRQKMEQEHGAPSTYERKAPSPYALKGDITEKQERFLYGLLRKVKPGDWERLGLDRISGFDDPPSQQQIRSLSKRKASEIIDALVKAGFYRRYAGEDLEF